MILQVTRLALFAPFVSRALSIFMYADDLILMSPPVTNMTIMPYSVYRSYLTVNVS